MQRFVQVGRERVTVEVADTDALRAQGLSGRDSLAEDAGMLFVLDTDGHWAISMKDMRFPIDIVWLDKEGLVLTIVEHVAPESYPQVLVPTAPARYVLELPAGAVNKYDLAEGEQIVL